MNIFVAKLSYNTKDDTLRSIFEQFGEVTTAKIIFDKIENRSKGFGFVEMATPEEAQAAIAMWHEKELDGRKIMVNEARPKEEKNDR